MKNKMIEVFFVDLNDYMNFFLNLKEVRRATSDSKSIAVLKKENSSYLYILQWEDGRHVGEYVRPFRVNENNLQIFNRGCAEIARRLQIYIETDDPDQVPMTPPAFGILSCEPANGI